jgi:hypothetical protein
MADRSASALAGARPSQPSSNDDTAATKRRASASAAAALRVGDDRRLVVGRLPQLARVLGRPHQVVVEPPADDECPSKQRPDAAMSLSVKLFLAERRTRRIEHRVVRGADCHECVPVPPRRLARRQARPRLCQVLGRARAHALPSRTTLSRSTSRMKNESSSRRPRSQSTSKTFTEIGTCSPSSRAASSRSSSARS